MPARRPAVSDVNNLRASDIDWTTETMVVGRGSQSERRISLDPDAFAVLRVWHERRTKLGIPGDLFICQ